MVVYTKFGNSDSSKETCGFWPDGIHVCNIILFKKSRVSLKNRSVKPKFDLQFDAEMVDGVCMMKQPLIT